MCGYGVCVSLVASGVCVCAWYTLACLWGCLKALDQLVGLWETLSMLVLRLYCSVVPRAHCSKCARVCGHARCARLQFCLLTALHTCSKGAWGVSAPSDAFCEQTCTHIHTHMLCDHHAIPHMIHTPAHAPPVNCTPNCNACIHTCIGGLLCKHQHLSTHGHFGGAF